MNYRITAMACALCLALTGSLAALAAGLAQSASKVAVNAEYVGQAADSGARRIRVQLVIHDGWHVNANPASLDFLVPTTIQARAGDKKLPLQIDWPTGHDSGVELGGTAVKVYDDDTIIPVRLARRAVRAAREAGQLELDIRVQACSNDGICLPPSTLVLKLADG